VRAPKFVGSVRPNGPKTPRSNRVAPPPKNRAPRCYGVITKLSIVYLSFGAFQRNFRNAHLCTFKLNLLTFIKIERRLNKSPILHFTNMLLQLHKFR